MDIVDDSVSRCDMTNFINKIARPEIVSMAPYSSARSENRLGKIYLNANENSVSCARGKALNRYPEPQPQNLIRKLSALYEVSDRQILVTRGSDEAIDLLFRGFCRPYKDQSLICSPTYGMYKVAASIQGTEVLEVPLIKYDGFSLDIAGIKNAATPTLKLVFICSPNNPTGNLFPQKDVLEICREMKGKALVIVDEAYIEFAETTSMTNFLDEFANLVVLRTMSKLYGLAGVRCGALIAGKDIIDLLRKVIAPYPIPSKAGAIVVKHLTNNLSKIKDELELIRSERESMYEFLRELPFVIKAWPSRANFLLVNVKDARKFMKHCEVSGIIIRDRSLELGLKNCVRISIGTRREKAVLKKALQRF